ncbi:MAG: alpha/beta fold hydrolase [Isosphaeraceae bacterium]
MRVRAVLVVAAMLAATSGAGCQSPGIRPRALRALPVVRAGTASLHGPGVAEYERLREQVEAGGGATSAALVELAERADEIGRRELRRDPLMALPWFRDASAYSAFALTRGTPGADEFERARAVEVHNHAVAELLRCSGAGPKPVNPGWREQLAAVGVVPAPTAPERATLPLDQLWVADDFRVRNLEPIRRDGLGVPLVEVSYFPNRDARPDHFLPERLRLPTTAVFRPSGPLEGGAWRGQPSALALHDAAHEGSLTLAPGQSPVPLAADLTTPMAHQLVLAPLDRLAWGGLLRPGTYNNTLGIYMYGPYQPGRIPVLFVHGLWSSPDVWLKMGNALQGDPLIRERYQFWYAFYPTGAPMMVSAYRLRKALADLRASIDPNHADAALDQMVLVGHSLGGVLSKQFIQSSGDRLEKGLFTRPFDQVAMSDEHRALLREIFYFEPVPSVRRAVFIAAPHRGSNTANQLLGRTASALVRRADDINELHAEILRLNGPEVVQPFYRNRPPSSVDNLEWNSPILRTLAELPRAPGVPCHSIVANLFPAAPPRFWTDGVVSYESAHLDDVESEVMVRHNHFANDTPEATAEVHRILRLHVGAPDGP